MPNGHDSDTILNLQQDLVRERETRRIVDNALLNALSLDGALEALRKIFEGPEFFEHDRRYLEISSEMLRNIHEARVKR